MRKHLFKTASLLLMSLSLVSCGYSEVTYEEFHQHVLEAKESPYTTAIANGYITMTDTAWNSTSSGKFDNLEFTRERENFWTYKKDTGENALAAILLTKTAKTVMEDKGDTNNQTYYLGDGFKYKTVYTDDNGTMTSTTEYDKYGNITKLESGHTGTPNGEIVDADITFKYSK